MMFIYKYIQKCFIGKTLDVSNQSLSLDNNNIKEELLEKCLDVSNNNILISENDIEPLLEKSIDISNQIQNVEKKSNKNYSRYFKKSIFKSSCIKNQIESSISETKELLKETENLTEIIPTLFDNSQNIVQLSEKEYETDLNQFLLEINNIINESEETTQPISEETTQPKSEETEQQE